MSKNLNKRRSSMRTHGLGISAVEKQLLKLQALSNESGKWRQDQTQTQMKPTDPASGCKSGGIRVIHFLPNDPETLALLIAGQQLLKDPSRSCKGSMKQCESYCINGALFEVGTQNYKMPDDNVSDHRLYYRGGLIRGQITEPF